MFTTKYMHLALLLLALLFFGEKGWGYTHWGATTDFGGGVENPASDNSDDSDDSDQNKLTKLNDFFKNLDGAPSREDLAKGFELFNEAVKTNIADSELNEITEKIKNLQDLVLLLESAEKLGTEEGLGINRPLKLQIIEKEFEEIKESKTLPEGLIASAEDQIQKLSKSALTLMGKDAWNYAATLGKQMDEAVRAVIPASSPSTVYGPPLPPKSTWDSAFDTYLSTRPQSKLDPFTKQWVPYQDTFEGMRDSSMSLTDGGHSGSTNPISSLSGQGPATVSQSPAPIQSSPISRALASAAPESPSPSVSQPAFGTGSVRPSGSIAPLPSSANPSTLGASGHAAGTFNNAGNAGSKGGASVLPVPTPVPEALGLGAGAPAQPPGLPSQTPATEKNPRTLAKALPGPLLSLGEVTKNPEATPAVSSVASGGLPATTGQAVGPDDNGRREYIRRASNDRTITPPKDSSEFAENTKKRDRDEDSPKEPSFDPAPSYRKSPATVGEKQESKSYKGFVPLGNGTIEIESLAEQVAQPTPNSVDPQTGSNSSISTNEGETLRAQPTNDTKMGTNYDTFTAEIIRNPLASKQSVSPLAKTGLLEFGNQVANATLQEGIAQEPARDLALIPVKAEVGPKANSNTSASSQKPSVTFGGLNNLKRQAQATLVNWTEKFLKFLKE